MAKSTLFAIGLDIPEVEGVRCFDLFTKVSFLDADVVIIRPTLSDLSWDEMYQGQRLLSEGTSARIRDFLPDLRERIAAARDTGATIIYMLPPQEVVSYDTGERSYSGTGRNRQVTKHVASFSNYTIIPIGGAKIVHGHGENIKLAPRGALLSTFHAEFEEHLFYNCHFTHESLTPLLLTKAGSHPVAAISNRDALFLPDLRLDENENWEWENQYSRQPTVAGKQLALRLRDAFLALHKARRSQVDITPAPEWTRSGDFTLAGEDDAVGEVLEIQEQIQSLKNDLAGAEARLEEVKAPLALLYEKGKALEVAVRSALAELGFQTKNFEQDGSEFDAVFESAEGRFIGEVEGKDKQAVNVAKISQIRRNVDEDFARDEVDSPAIGVLFGNGFRLQDVKSRPETFTEKVVKSAPQLGIVLVRTTDLFRVLQQFRASGRDDFAAACRNSIAESVGEIVKFPDLGAGAKAKTVKD